MHRERGAQSHKNKHDLGQLMTGAEHDPAFLFYAEQEISPDAKEQLFPDKIKEITIDEKVLGDAQETLRGLKRAGY